MALVNAEDLSKNNLDLINGQLSLIRAALNGSCNMAAIKSGLALLEIYADDMYCLAEKLSKEANEIWEVVSKEEG